MALPDKWVKAASTVWVNAASEAANEARVLTAEEIVVLVLEATAPIIRRDTLVKIVETLRTCVTMAHGAPWAASEVSNLLNEISNSLENIANKTTI